MIRDAAARGRPVDDRLITRAARLDGFLRPSLRERILAELAESPNGTSHGAELKAVLEVSGGSVSPELRRLSENGWVTVTVEGSSTELKRTPKQYVTITPAGRRELARLSEQSLGESTRLVETITQLHLTALEQTSRQRPAVGAVLRAMRGDRR
jgi:DNA-binding PadR family transcriptional regulator